MFKHSLWPTKRRNQLTEMTRIHRRRDRTGWRTSAFWNPRLREENLKMDLNNWTLFIYHDNIYSCITFPPICFNFRAFTTTTSFIFWAEPGPKGFRLQLELLGLLSCLSAQVPSILKWLWFCSLPKLHLKLGRNLRGSNLCRTRCSSWHGQSLNSLASGLC